MDFPNTWEEKLPLLQFAVNDAYCVATKTTPFRVIFGKDPAPPPLALPDTSSAVSRNVAGESSSPDGEDQTQFVETLSDSLLSVWEFVSRHQQLLADRMKAREDKRRREFNCSIGDLVWVSAKFHPQLRATRKQAERYYGPYIVSELRGSNAVVLERYARSSS